jgi:AraC family transcriptional regulator
MTTGTRRDRLRELLEAVLDEGNATLADMAGDAFSSPFHFTRQLSRDAGEPPVAMRRRVMLERAAWQLQGGAAVTDVAFAAGYDSVEGFSRAFSRAWGHPPSAVRARPAPAGPAGSGHWLEAPNGIHFHPPMHLWVSERIPERTDMQLTAHLIHHDLDDTDELIRLAGSLDDADYRRTRLPGHVLLEWDGPEESIATVLEHQVWSKEVWLASLEGRDFPERGGDSAPELARRHAAAAPRWVAAVRDIESRDAWGDRVVDALCEPPESFVLGSVVAHVITYAAHRRQLVRHLLRAAGLDVGHGDPIEWLRGRA